MLEVMVIPGTQLDWLVPRDERTVVLRGGARAVVRRLASGEAKVVQEVFDGMSERSRYQRFAGAKPVLSSRDLEILTAVDHDKHEAFVAVDPQSGRAVAEAHLVRDGNDRAVAEVAIDPRRTAERALVAELGTPAARVQGGSGDPPAEAVPAKRSRVPADNRAPGEPRAAHRELEGACTRDDAPGSDAVEPWCRRAGRPR